MSSECLCKIFSFLACLEVAEKFVVVVVVEHVATISNLNPSCLELIWVELGLGFDNFFASQSNISHFIFIARKKILNHNIFFNAKPFWTQKSF